jgi:hypothetical protein
VLSCMGKFSMGRRDLHRGMWQTRHTAGQVMIKPPVAGTGRPARRLRGQLFGPGGNTTPEYWIDGGDCGLLRRRHSGKGREVPERLPVDP